MICRICNKPMTEKPCTTEHAVHRVMIAVRELRREVVDALPKPIRKWASRTPTGDA